MRLLEEHSKSWLAKDLDGPCSVTREEGFCKYSFSIVQVGIGDGGNSSQACFIIIAKHGFNSTRMVNRIDIFVCTCACFKGWLYIYVQHERKALLCSEST